MTIPAGASATARLAHQAAALDSKNLPDEVLVVAKQCVLDAIGVALAGASSQAARLVADAVLEDAPTGPCTIIGDRATTSASGAALVNGTAMHALDYDDMSVPLCGHPSAPLLPALFALGESTGRSGAELLGAFVAGYEAECRLGGAVDPSHYARGFHATATVGTIGAAVGAGHLLGLDASRLEQAIGIGATQAGGLKAMFGTMCKPLHAGRAAASGILAARLARGGFTSAEDALATEQGFAFAMADRLDLALLDAPFGEPWHILSNLFKFHAACYFTHGTINAMLALHEQGITADQVDKITVRVTPGHLSVCNIVKPTTGLEGKFSLRFATAVALQRGQADESSFTDDLVAAPELIALCKKVTVEGDSALGAYDTGVTVELTEGVRELAEHTGRPAWQNDPGEQQPALLAKFMTLTAPLLGRGRAEELAEMLLHLDELGDLRALQPFLQPLDNHS